MFNAEKFEHECKLVVKLTHALALTYSELEMQARELIGGKLVANELHIAAMQLYTMEDFFRNEVFEIGDDDNGN